MTTPDEQYAAARREYEAARAAFDAAREAMCEARDRMHAAGDRARAARLSSGMSVGGVVFGSGAGFVADTVTGGMHTNTTVIGGAYAGSVTIGGEVITHGAPMRCKSCGGTRGWHRQFGHTWHTGCGAEQ